MRWRLGFAYLKSAHQLWPLSLNRQPPGTAAAGALLHQKFLAEFTAKVADPDHVAEHTAEYGAYRGGPVPDGFVHPSTRRFTSSHDVLAAGLMRAVDW